MEKSNHFVIGKENIQSMISLTKKLIEFENTNKSNVNSAIEYTARWLNNRGIHTKIKELNGFKSVVSEIGNSNGPTIILNGHIDVVPGDKDQYLPHVEEGKIFGRGSYDMLGSVSVMMHVMEYLKSQNFLGKVILCIVPDEETGGNNGSRFLVKEGIVGDIAICGEPTNLDIAIQAKGILQLKLEFQGISAHSSRPWLGQNAILSALSTFNAIQNLDFFKKGSEFFEKPSLNLSRIQGGEVINKVPNECNIHLDIRFLPNQDPDEIIRQIKNLCDAKVTILDKGDPVLASQKNELIINLKESTERTLGKSVDFFGQDGSADTRFYSKIGIPAVEFGPSGSNHHARGEFVEINSMIEFKKILVDYVLNLKYTN